MSKVTSMRRQWNEETARDTAVKPQLQIYKKDGADLKNSAENILQVWQNCPDVDVVCLTRRRRA